MKTTQTKTAKPKSIKNEHEEKEKNSEIYFKGKNKIFFWMASEQEDPYIKRSKSEMVQIVDDNNERVRGATRLEMRNALMWHRASCVFIETNAAHGKKLLVQKRTMKKDFFPGFFDLVTGGVLGHNEDDDENAMRELDEELGITGFQL